jgi:hypothetical protein
MIKMENKKEQIKKYKVKAVLVKELPILGALWGVRKWIALTLDRQEDLAKLVASTRKVFANLKKNPKNGIYIADGSSIPRCPAYKPFLEHYKTPTCRVYAENDDSLLRLLLNLRGEGDYIEYGSESFKKLEKRIRNLATIYAKNTELDFTARDYSENDTRDVQFKGSSFEFTVHEKTGFKVNLFAKLAKVTHRYIPPSNPRRDEPRDRLVNMINNHPDSRDAFYARKELDEYDTRRRREADSGSW